MTDSVRELAPFVAAFIGGWGGLASALSWMSIADALNRSRTPEDQIPTLTGSWTDLKRHWELAGSYGLFYRWKLLKEFHRDNPNSRLYFWCVGGEVWLFGFMCIAAVIVLVGP